MEETKRLNVLYEKNWTRLVTEQLKRFERVIVESGKIDGGLSTNSMGAHWTFGGALLYTVTLLTTIGYGRLSPRTAPGKILAMVYALIGVPLMLILLSALGTMLATGAKRAYSKLCCRWQHGDEDNSSGGKKMFTGLGTTSVGYHKAPSSPSAKHLYCKNMEDSASIQFSSASTHSTPNHVIICKTPPPPNHHPHYQHHHNHQQQQQQQYGNTVVDQHEIIPKKALLATVRATHARGRCRQTQVKQMLADNVTSSNEQRQRQIVTSCPAHSHQGTPTKTSFVLSGGSDIEDGDEADDSELGMCPTHDTPSRVPLIYHPPPSVEETSNRHGHSHHGRHRSTPPSCCGQSMTSSSPANNTSPSVPAILVLLFFLAYVLMGAAAFASTSGWTFLDAAYFCFIALATIGVGDKIPTAPHSSSSASTHQRSSTSAGGGSVGHKTGFNALGTQNADRGGIISDHSYEATSSSAVITNFDSSQVQMLACCLYLFVGLVVVAMCFSLVHEEITLKCRHLAHNMGLSATAKN